MKLGTVLGTTGRSIRRYRNRAEIMVSIAKKQNPRRVTLWDGSRFEAAEVFLGVIDEIVFQRVYSPTHLQIEMTDVVIDTGAHIGVFTVFAASQTENTVYAFEPFLGTF